MGFRWVCTPRKSFTSIAAVIVVYNSHRSRVESVYSEPIPPRGKKLFQAFLTVIIVYVQEARSFFVAPYFFVTGRGQRCVELDVYYPSLVTTSFPGLFSAEEKDWPILSWAEKSPGNEVGVAKVTANSINSNKHHLFFSPSKELLCSTVNLAPVEVPLRCKPSTERWKSVRK